MRLTLRVAALFAVALSAMSAMSCGGTSDGLTVERSVGGAQARVAIAPTLSSSALEAYAALAAMGVEVTSVRIRLVDLSGRAALDSVVVFPAGKDTLSLILAIDIQGREQQFDATVELRDASGLVQFASTLRVTARIAALPDAPAAAIVLQYVGPGYKARSVAVSPADATVLSGASQQLIATASDPSGAPVDGLTVVWTTSDSTIARITPTGNASATVTTRGPRGLVTLSARAPTGVTGTATLMVRPLPARLALISGAGQTGVAGVTLPTPLSVELQATDGRTIAGALVSFRAITPGGEVATASATTDALGRATTTMKLGRDAGSYAFESTSDALPPVTVSATATPATIGVPTQLIPLTPLPTSFKVGVASTQRFSAQLADVNGYYVLLSGVSVTATMVVSPGGATTSVTAVSDAMGVISIAVPAFTSAGTVLITLSSPVLQNLPYGTFTITP